jgi:hypothetical protein
MVLVGKIKERDRLEVSDAGKMITLKCVLKEMRQDLWNGCIWLRQEQVVGHCELGNELSDPIQCGELFD